MTGNLEHITLDYANLSNTNLKNVILDGADLTDVTR